VALLRPKGSSAVGFLSSLAPRDRGTGARGRL